MQSTALRPRTETRQQILDCAQNLVQSRGYNAFSYADIAEVVGIRKASIHYHFPTKALLGQALLARYAEQFSQSLDQIRTEKSSARDRLVALVEIYEEMLSQDRLCLAAMLGAGALATPQELREGTSAFFADTAAWIAEVIREGDAAGTLACKDPETAAKTLLAALMGTQLIARACGWKPGEFQATVVAGFITPLLT